MCALHLDFLYLFFICFGSVNGLVDAVYTKVAVVEIILLPVFEGLIIYQIF